VRFAAVSDEHAYSMLEGVKLDMIASFLSRVNGIDVDDGEWYVVLYGEFSELKPTGEECKHPLAMYELYFTGSMEAHTIPPLDK
jgi:hypothetical protein